MEKPWNSTESQCRDDPRIAASLHRTSTCSRSWIFKLEIFVDLMNSVNFIVLIHYLTATFDKYVKGKLPRHEELKSFRNGWRVIKLVKMMKRENEIENPQKTKREKMTQAVKTETESSGVGGDHLAWDIIISRLDYKSQMKISHQNKRLAEVVLMNAESDLRKFRCHIQENKYM